MQALLAVELQTRQRWNEGLALQNGPEQVLQVSDCDRHWATSVALRTLFRQPRRT